MKVFIIGTSGVGKTPLAEKIAGHSGAIRISASEAVCARFTLDRTVTPRDEWTEAASQFSIEEFRRDPDRNVRFMSMKYDLTSACVIEGIRNPYDFCRLFDPKSDVVIFMSNKFSHVPVTELESGIDVIKSYIGYLEKIAAITVGQVQRIDTSYNGFSFDAFAEEIAEQMRESEVVSDQHGYVHVNIRPIKALIEEKFLYDMDEQYAGKYIPCSITAVSSYPGLTPSFIVLTHGGAQFHEIPIHALRSCELSSALSEPLPLNDLCYHDCHHKEITVAYLSMFDTIAGKDDVLCYFRHAKKWIKGRYHFSIDWYTGNDLLHFIQLENGQYALLPPHKVKFGNAEKIFPPYRKLHARFSVE